MNTDCTPSIPQTAIDPVKIADVLDGLAERINADGNADLLAPWTV